ncbi:MAG TPA: putative glycoside hydrolase [Candidatus Sulfotelmatobacter sp.]|nr:putative glycoside hydrolase [Candidatus Sulfotelmatobacter sp.]
MRLSSVRIIAGTFCLLFGAAAWRLAPHSANDFVAQAQTAKPAVATQNTGKLQTASVTTKPSIPDPKPLAAPGTEVYTARRGEAIPTIARRYLSKTSYLTSTELADAIRQVNHKSDSSNILKANENIVIPGIISAPVTEKTIPIAKDFEVRAIYLTGFMAGSEHGLRVIKHWREVGGNAVVFDIKDSDGSVTIPFEHPLLGPHPVYVHDVPKLVHFLHSQNMHAIARIAIFRDERLVVNHPDLAVQSRKNHTAWRENGKLVWTDPSNPKVQDYDIALAKYVAGLGVDEIQFDYVRFPAEGDQKDALFVFQKDQPETADAEAEPSVSPDSTCLVPAPKPRHNKGTQGASTASTEAPKMQKGPCPVAKKLRGPQRSDVITAFLKKAYNELHPTGVLLSLDVFGVMAWQRPIDLSHTGQDIVNMAHYCDVLSPMIYPSHFFGMDGIAHPGDEPAHFIGESMDRFELITKGSGVVIRPWLQAFHWRTKIYSPEYIKIQVEVARQKGGVGFLFWNAANDYSKPFTAMPEMKSANYKEGSKDNPKYFRGDELPTATVQASLNPAPQSATR